MHYRLRRSAVGAVLAVSAIAGYACKEKGGSTEPKDNTAGVANSTRSDADILGLLHEANRAEIVAGQLAIQRGVTGDVKLFATSMVAEHTALDATVDGVARQLQITPTVPNDELAKLQNAEISQMSGFSGITFSFHYMSVQITAHERTLTLVDAFIAKAQQAALRNALQNDVRPHIVAHLAAAQQIRGRIQGP